LPSKPVLYESFVVVEGPEAGVLYQTVALGFGMISANHF
jgi:hypothetical protein